MLNDSSGGVTPSEARNLALILFPPSRSVAVSSDPPQPRARFVAPLGKTPLTELVRMTVEMGRPAWGVFDLSAYICASGEEVCAFAWGDGIEQIPDFLPEGIDIAFGCFAEQRLEFGKELFDRVQVRRVRWQIE